MFQFISFTYMPRVINKISRCYFGSMLKIPDNTPLKLIDIEVRNNPAYELNVEEEPDDKP